MKKRGITFKYKDKKHSIGCFECNSLEKLRGLTFTSRKSAKALLFEFKSKNSGKSGKNPAIHSFFVFFPFIAMWLDKNNNAIEIKKVKPFTFHVRPKKPFSRLIEIPINNRYSKILKNLGF
jgi:uncharacterized membrane protein (UPF0127 family)